MKTGDYVFATHASAKLDAFPWFLKLTVHSAVVWVPLVLLLVVMVIAFRQSELADRRKYWLLLIPPALWIFVGSWGSYFWLDWARKPFVPNPAWVHQVVVVTLAAFLISGIALIVSLRGARVFTAIYVVINLFLVLAMSFLASMAISGTWL